MAFLLPDSLRQATQSVLAGSGEGAGLGSVLVRWWRSRDPLPATVWNERIVEHLERVAVALDRYPYERGPSGFDERGRIYVRLGQPSRVVEVDSEYLKSPGAFSEALEYPDALVMPRNEVWVYDRLGATALFIFVWRSGRFRISNARHLLPTPLQYSFADTKRGRALAKMAAYAMRDLLDELAVLNLEYAKTYDEYDDFIFDLEFGGCGGSVASGAGAAEADGSSLIRAATGGGGTVVWCSRFGPTPVRLTTAGQLLANIADQEDFQIARRRRGEVPNVSTDVYRSAPFPVITRTARFLDPDGTTRTEVYWAVPLAGLNPPVDAQVEMALGNQAPPDVFELKMSAVQYTDDYRPRKLARDRKVLTRATYDEANIPVFTTTVAGDTGRYSLAVQWDQYLVQEEGGEPSLSYARTGTFRADSLAALTADPDKLEMSDLVPLGAEAVLRVSTVRNEGGFTVPVYPFDTIAPERELALYFEAYHLGLDADGRTHYTVEYEIMHESRVGGIKGFLGKRVEEATMSSSAYEGRTSTVREYVVIDTREFDEGTVRVNVRLTDTTTGQTVERAISFEVISPV